MKFSCYFCMCEDSNFVSKKNKTDPSSPRWLLGYSLLFERRMCSRYPTACPQAPFLPRLDQTGMCSQLTVPRWVSVLSFMRLIRVPATPCLWKTQDSRGRCTHREATPRTKGISREIVTDDFDVVSSEASPSLFFFFF